MSLPMQRRRFLTTIAAVVGGLLMPKAVAKAAVKPTIYKTMIRLSDGAILRESIAERCWRKCENPEQGVAHLVPQDGREYSVVAYSKLSGRHALELAKARRTKYMRSLSGIELFNLCQAGPLPPNWKIWAF